MKNFLEAIGNFFNSAWHTLMQYLHTAIPEIKVAILNDLLSIADPIIADLQNQNLTGEQKRQQAVGLIQGAIAKIGLDVSLTLIHAALELAVLKRQALDAQIGNAGVLPAGVQTTPPSTDV